MNGLRDSSSFPIETGRVVIGEQGHPKEGVSHIDNFILQLDGAPPHRSVNVQDYLDEHLSHRLFGQVADYNMPLTK
ncbi:hypothetical protein TNCV_2094221 [Trichonephila clavipes]|nr:hypothetical protein TNCV_2094221 [Trichonephila clavipes]